jgi:hypothetical protein
VPGVADGAGGASDHIAPCFDIREFDCHEPTCDAPAGERSRAAGFRFQSATDEVSIALTCTCTAFPPTYTLDGRAPGDLRMVATGPLVSAPRTIGGSNFHVASILKVADVARPPVTADNGGEDLQTIADNMEGGLGAEARPELRPFSNHEVYRLTLACLCAACGCSIDYAFPVWDGDLVILCYKFDQAQMRYKKYGSSSSLLPRRTLREFLAFFAETGAIRLFREYTKTRTSELDGATRRVADPGIAASISAMLAEETYKAFVNGERGHRLWAGFFAGEDMEIPPGGATFWEWSRVWTTATSFGQCHTRLGIASCVTVLDGPCVADDLDLVVEELVDANSDNVNDMVSMHRFIRRGIRPLPRFRKQMRKAILQGLKDADKLTLRKELRRRWQM